MFAAVRCRCKATFERQPASICRTYTKCLNVIAESDRKVIKSFCLLQRQTTNSKGSFFSRAKAYSEKSAQTPKHSSWSSEHHTNKRQRLDLIIVTTPTLPPLLPSFRLSIDQSIITMPPDATTKRLNGPTSPTNPSPKAPDAPTKESFSSTRPTISNSTAATTTTSTSTISSMILDDGDDVITLIDIITSKDDEIRHLSLSDYCSCRTTQALLEECDELDRFAKSSTNLYERVRALFFLYAIHRFHLNDLPSIGGGACGDNDSNSSAAMIPYEGYKLLLDRNFEDAIEIFLKIHHQQPSKAISSALTKGYYHLGFQTLANQVRMSVKNHPGNLWMFQCLEANQYPQTIHHELLNTAKGSSNKRLVEYTPVRMDLSHCCWSDIFFLGMDFPEGARVLNVSIDLAVRGRHEQPIPPLETYLEVIDEPVLKLTSIDLKSTVTLTKISEVFEFGKDYLGLLRAGIVASGVVPPGLEHSDQPLSELFETSLGVRGKGLHLTTKVNDIPKGSRLAVSTNLLASIIAIGMRATGQTQCLTGQLSDDERRLVAARAILGEWLGGSAGGWQDSVSIIVQLHVGSTRDANLILAFSQFGCQTTQGGLWPGIKLIEGVSPKPADPEHGMSRGRLLPLHRQLSNAEAPESLTTALQDSLVLVHGGLAQNVGPVLEMVTEKYLLREAEEWKARQESIVILDEILLSLKKNNINELAKLTTHNFNEPIQTIIPWASNLYTETLIERTKSEFGDDFLGFWMLGGCSGGGMGFIFKPEAKPRALVVMQEIMLKSKRELEYALPFAMDPVVYDFSINENGTVARFFDGTIPTIETASRTKEESTCKQVLAETSIDQVLQDIGFDAEAHEMIRSDYISGRIGLKENRLALDTVVSDASGDDVIQVVNAVSQEDEDLGLAELKNGTVGVVTLAAGVGSRWTQGAGCVKAIHPFCKLAGRHRSFLEIHLAKSRRISDIAECAIPHVITTSHMTHDPLETYLDRVENHGYEGPLYKSKGKSVGVRLIPCVRDMKFAWEETQQQKLDEQQQKIRESGHSALIGWASSCGEASDYRDNLPLQCLHPVGHYYEIPNLLLNGTLKDMLEDRPQLKYLMLHNIDTVGADVDPSILGLFVKQSSTLSFEVVPREIQDVGGGLARINGESRLIEGLALPREEDEFTFSYYNSMTTWIRIDKLLEKYGLAREDLDDPIKVANAVKIFSRRLPTYVTLKDVKKRWGNGQEDIFPTAQFEKLWSDMSSLEDVDCTYFAVPRARGNQLKDQAQLDGWLRDGSAAYLEQICTFSD